MENWLLMYNPASGGGKKIKAELDDIIGIFERADKFITLYRLDRDNKTDIEQVLDAGHFDAVLACGGDGSVKSIGGMLARKKLDVPFGVLPNGTCNDFARSLGLPTELRKCAEVLAKGRCKRVDVGVANGEYFVNTLAGGVMANVSYTVENDLKQKFGPLAYYVAGIGELAKVKTFPIVIETEEGQTLETDAYLFLGLNGTDAAGLTGLIKNAVMDDGNLDILLFKKMPFFDVADTLLKLVTTANFREKCVERVRTRKCTISCADTTLTTSLDGEKGPDLPLEIEILPQALNVLY